MTDAVNCARCQSRPYPITSSGFAVLFEQRSLQPPQLAAPSGLAPLLEIIRNIHCLCLVVDRAPNVGPKCATSRSTCKLLLSASKTSVQRSAWVISGPFTRAGGPDRINLGQPTESRCEGRDAHH